ncbi:MAG: hypothetical protein IJQ16_02080 [Selenomonadaceae bacterium]|nr:hypothetical protein [Selenomonadaceae bacterium]
MSNPGVIELFGFNFKNNFGSHNFRVEDNIGESIHFHFDNIRLDLTVKEFRKIADDLLDAINGIVNVKGFDAKKVDSRFLFEIAECLPYLREVRIEPIPVKNLIVDTNSRGGRGTYTDTSSIPG